MLDLLGPATRAWFAATFAAPTRVQTEGWPRIAAGQHALLAAPTGSGKTLAAFLMAIDRLARDPAPAEPGVRVLYVSPLKALAYDIERNLRVPLAGTARAAEGLGVAMRHISVGVRTGDTPARERQRLLREPADILITTPESLYLMLSSQARATLARVDTVIVDEIHALAPTKRGAHLMLSLERLVEIAAREPQRIGLSATARPLDEVARFLGGADRPVAIVDATEAPRIDVTIEVPEDRNPRLLELVRAHRSTIIFANSRRLTERLAQELNDLDGGPVPLVRAHHGSIARAQRLEIEEQLKLGQLRGLVATSSLELGIDMGAVDLVVQIESPGAVARGLQRIGRAGHQVGARSVGRIFPKNRGDLLEATVVAKEMVAGAVEPLRVPRNALDVLAQQIVAACADGEWPVARVERMVRRAYGYRDLPPASFAAVLEMLAGRYPSDEFPDLKPRIVWDRARDVVASRRDARLVAITSGGTIPDRGLYAVHVGAGGPRIGELDEEMVHESRTGQTFFLGASTWRILEITRDRVIVAPAPGEPGKLPFWRGEGPGRPIELGRAMGAFVRTVGGMADAQGFLEREYRLEPSAAESLVAYLADQRAAVGALPTDDCITVERFRDELGDWRVCILTPFGARVHAPWALYIEQRLGGGGTQAIWSDDGIALRFADREPPEVGAYFPEPDEVAELLDGELPGSALFATAFRENAARALLLPRRRGGARTPLWLQRMRAGNLLQVASKFPSFPIILETFREIWLDVFDMPALEGLLGQVARREIRVVSVETAGASPFARGLAFAYVAAFLYEGDAPLAERKAQALALDRTLLRELLGQEELRDLLDPVVLEEVEAELQGLAEDRRARSADALHDLLRRVGELDEGELALRAVEAPQPWLSALRASGRALPVRIAGRERWIAAEDAGRYRDALGVQPPAGVATVFLEPTTGALEGLVARFARTHAPFTSVELAGRFGLVAGQVEPALRALAHAGRVVEGELRPSGKGQEWCDVEVLRQLRRRTLARLRGEVAPVEAAAFARFLGRWQRADGTAALADALEQLEGLPLPFEELEGAILPARVKDFRPAQLDELGAMGEIVWVGAGEGRVALARRERAHLVLPEPASAEGEVVARLRERGALFFPELGLASADDLWPLVWAGLITNDTFQALRGKMGGRWSLVRARAAAPTERAHAAASMLLERYGVVAREAAAAEEIPGGFAALAPVLRAMEEAGRIRRGHFVDGLTGAQYAHAGAVDRLRAARADDGAAVVLAAVDPAQPYGAILPWPDAGAGARPRRVAGGRVALVAGAPVFFLERGGDKLVYFPGDGLAAGVAALRKLAYTKRHRQLRIAQVNGDPALASPLATTLETAGFTVAPGGLVLDA